MRPSTAAARVTENWLTGAFKPNASGRDWPKADNSQKPTASAAKDRVLTICRFNQGSANPSHNLIFWQMSLFCGAKRVGRDLGRRPWAPHGTPLSRSVLRPV